MPIPFNTTLSFIQLENEVSLRLSAATSLEDTSLTMARRLVRNVDDALIGQLIYFQADDDENDFHAETASLISGLNQDPIFEYLANRLKGLVYSFADTLDAPLSVLEEPRQLENQGSCLISQGHSKEVLRVVEHFLKNFVADFKPKIRPLQTVDEQVLVFDALITEVETKLRIAGASADGQRERFANACLKQLYDSEMTATLLASAVSPNLADFFALLERTQSATDGPKSLRRTRL